MNDKEEEKQRQQVEQQKIFREWQDKEKEKRKKDWNKILYEDNPYIKK